MTFTEHPNGITLKEKNIRVSVSEQKINETDTLTLLRIKRLTEVDIQPVATSVFEVVRKKRHRTIELTIRGETLALLYIAIGQELLRRKNNL